MISLEHHLLLCLAVVTLAYSTYQCLLPPGLAKPHVNAVLAQQSPPGAPKSLTTLPPAGGSQRDDAAPTAVSDQTTVDLLQLQAVRALVSGHRQQALALYEQLAAAAPSVPEYRAAARILSKKVTPVDKPAERQ
jgi:hypothetical protein